MKSWWEIGLFKKRDWWFVLPLTKYSVNFVIIILSSINFSWNNYLVILVIDRNFTLCKNLGTYIGYKYKVMELFEHEVLISTFYPTLDTRKRLHGAFLGFLRFELHSPFMENHVREGTFYTRDWTVPAIQTQLDNKLE